MDKNLQQAAHSIARFIESTNGITDDGRAWTRWTNRDGMPRATNAYWTDPRKVASEIRYAEATQAQRDHAVAETVLPGVK